MATDTQRKVCLDVAVDHRIRRFFKSVPHGLKGESDHVAGIVAEGCRLNRPDDEIRVTAKLAGPPSKGGIAIALQQPRDNHPYDKGLDAVIEDCRTLRALDDMFDAASCGSLDIRTNIAVVDLLPFVAKNANTLDDRELKDSFRASVQTICEKEPDILLCAGKIRLPWKGRGDDRKGDAWRFESVGLGVQFGSTPKLPVTAKVRHGKRGFVNIPRVNGFHPSHAINHLSHVSLLRQLQMLIAVQTCRTLEGNWKKEDWMNEMTNRCQDKSRLLTGESPTKSPPVRSPGQSHSRRNSGTKYLPDWQDVYSDKILDLKNCIIALLSSPGLQEKPPGVSYKAILSSGLSELCNDVTLILRQITRLLDRGWLDSVAWKNERALREISTDTLVFAEDLLKVAKTTRPSDLTKTIRSSIAAIVEISKDKDGKQPEYKYGVDPKKASEAFLKLATDIESMLFDLLVEKEKALEALRQEEIEAEKALEKVEKEEEEMMLSLMERMNLMPSKTSRAPVVLAAAP